MATAEAFRKNPEILEMEKFAIWKRSFDSLGSGVGKRMFRNVLASRIGRKIIFFYAGFVEKISPRGHHDFIFGLVASAYFRAGYRKGEKKFASKL